MFFREKNLQQNIPFLKKDVIGIEGFDAL